MAINAEACSTFQPHPLMRGAGIGNLPRLAAARTPGRLALVYGERRLTYLQLDEIIDRTANALAARGIGSKDRVALFSHNNASYVFIYFALARLGAISVPINFMLNAAEVGFILGHCGAKGLVAEQALLGTAEAALAACGVNVALRGVIVTQQQSSPPGWDDVAGWISHHDASPVDIFVPEDDPIQIMYTSGTESRPKGATLSSRAYSANYVSCIVNGEMSSEDVMVHSLPLYHCAQLQCFLTPGIMLGTVNVLLDAPDPRAILNAIENERATSLFCPPTVWISLLAELRREPRDLRFLKKGYYGASAMPTEIIRELLTVLPELRLFNFYGQTEMAPLATVLGPDDQLRKLGSAGRAVINVQTRIVDADDRPVANGTVGEIVHRSPQLLLSYWNDPEKSAEACRGGWFHSGDLGRMDEDGYLWVVDRKKDMIKSGGENVASREVEEVLYAHPEVAEAAVLGIPDPRWIEAVAAVIVLKPGSHIDEATVIQFCRGKLAGYKTPKRVIFTERLPKNASGKILKRELREQFASALCAKRSA